MTTDLVEMTDAVQSSFLDGTVVSLNPVRSDSTLRRGEPVTCGIPWPQGVVSDLARLVLVDQDGTVCPLQAKALDRWPDGSVRWSLLDWFADSGSGQTYSVGFLEEEESPSEGDSAEDDEESPLPRLICIQQTGKSVFIDTGSMRFELPNGETFPFGSVQHGEDSVIDAEKSRLCGQDASGQSLSTKIERVTIKQHRSVRVTVRLDGSLSRGSSKPLLKLLVYMHFFADSATVRFDVTVTNPRCAKHPGGKWELGDTGSVYLRDLSLRLVLPTENRSSGTDVPGVIRCSAESSETYEQFDGPIELYQDSSGGENFKSSNHINRKHEVPIRFRGYRLGSEHSERTGERATPVVAIERGGRHLAVAMEHFWQNFPKSLEATTESITLRLFPKQFNDVHEIQGGEQKTHTFYVAFHEDKVTDEPLAWCRSPLVIGVDPAWYANSGAVPYLIPKVDDPHMGYHELVDGAIEGENSFEQKREVIDEYGWRHFGDLYADHEASNHTRPAPLVSHYNNQYDSVAGFAYQYLRSGDRRWFDLMNELARHVIDIDVYHTDADKSAYNHGMFWHTYHYVDADTSTHRTYPASEGVCGGGPSAGHLYTTGLMLHYFLTGNPLSRQTAIELGQYVIAADDGRKTIFRFLDRGHTGHVTESSFDGYHGPGRSSANAINALLDAHRLTRDRRYLGKAEQLIQRCVHPDDDIDARNLLDAENRWFYTMFLQSLGKYLDHKAERRELDRMYEYAQAVLLHYARWMVEHEYPYLEKPEILEYPTETWAAQDMRKSEVFKIAARHASGAKRDQFKERACFFFDYSIRTLGTMPTRTLCRPVALMLSYGFSHASFFTRPIESAPAPDAYSARFGRPERFLPQKKRAIRRAKTLAAATFGLAVLVLLIVLT